MAKQAQLAEKQVLAAAIKAVRSATGLDLQLDRRDQKVTDGLMTIEAAGRSWTFTVETKLVVTPAVAALVSRKLPARRPPLLLVTRYINDDLGSRLRREGLCYIDTVGNAWLERPGLFVHVQGRRPPAAAPTGRGARIHSRAAIQLILPLLAYPGLEKAAMRDLANVARVSLGSADLIVQELQKQGFITGERRARRLINKEKLLEEWVAAYTARLRQKLVIGRFKALDAGWYERVQPDQHGASWSGEVAAAQLGLLDHPQTATLYAEALPTRLIVEARLARDEAGPIEILRRFWKELPNTAPPRAVVPLPLVYADLLAVGSDRIREVADAFRLKELAACLT